MKKNALYLFAFAALLSSACSNAPSAECIQYVDCQTAYVESFGGTEVDLSSYEAGGSCWDSETAASTCTEACTNAIDTIVAATAETDDGAPTECE